MFEISLYYHNFIHIKLIIISYVKNGVLYIKPTLTADRFGESFLTTGPLDLTNEGCNLNIEGWNCKM